MAATLWFRSTSGPFHGIGEVIARWLRVEIENLNLVVKFDWKITKDDIQRRDKYFICMYCIHRLCKLTFAYMF